MRRLAAPGLALALILAYVLGTSAQSAPGAGVQVVTLAEHNALEDRVSRLEKAATPTPAPTASPSPTATATPTASPTPGPLTNKPAQPAGLAYSSETGVTAYAKPGGLVIAGRDNHDAPAFKTVSQAGGHVLIYLDPIIDNAYGPYHQLLLKASTCGPAVPRWPGPVQANTYGYLNDFRAGGVLQAKFECVLERMVADNPHMAGWFLDDLGSRSWFPGFSWEGWGTTNQQAYRNGAIELAKTARKVADRHGLIFLVNGTWGAGTLSGNGGGYPNMSAHGLSLADGGFVENHDGESAYFGPYGCSSQWASASPVTQGKAFNYATNRTTAGRTEYANTGCYAYVATQGDYGTIPTPWGPFHPTGLPSHS